MAPDTRALTQLLGRMFQSHPWHGVSAGDAEGLLTAFVEITPADPVKYELDKATGILRVDRPQRFSSLPPTLYGFIPQTYCAAKVARRAEERSGKVGLKGDGDPLDVCVLTEKGFGAANFLCRVRPVGGLRMLDNNEADDKVVAVLEGDLAYGDVTELSQLPRGLVDRLVHYFGTYKQLPSEAHRRVAIDEVYDAAEAREVVRRSLEDYRDVYGQPEERVAELARLLREG
jgi:inorganic pyrophosphatase